MSSAFPNDSPLSLVPGEPDSGAEPAATPDEGAGGTPNAAGLSPGEQLGTVLARTMEPFVQGTRQEMNELRQQLNRVVDTLSRQPQAVASKPGEGKDAKLERFVADPDAYEADLVERASKATIERIAPYIMGPSSAVQEQTLEAEAAQIDAEYGPGTFNELVRPSLEGALQQMAEPLRYNPQALRTAVSALTGSRQMRPQLLAKRDAYVKQQAEARKAAQAKRQGPPSFLGSRSRGEDGRPVITPEDRQVLAAIEKSGYSMSENELRAVRSVPRGVSLDDQLAALERATKGAA